MSHLNRSLAPFSESTWEQIDREAAKTLRRTLAARHLVEIGGPHGWERSSIGMGRTRAIAAPVPEVEASLRKTHALVEIRTPFSLARSELDAIERGASDPDFTPLNEAARIAAHAEDKAVFDGFKAAGIRGLLEAGDAQALSIDEDYEAYPKVIATALSRLRDRGVDGPYVAALSPRCHQGLTETINEGGYPIMKLIQQQLDAIVWAPSLEGAVVLSTRGGDFQLELGQDFAIGYRRHDADRVDLYLEESFTFLCRDDGAVIPLRLASSPQPQGAAAR